MPPTTYRSTTATRHFPEWQLNGSSCLRGNYHEQFLGGSGAAMRPGYPASCDPGQVHVITHVETTNAEVLDHQRTDPIQQALIDQGVPPGQHLVDAGYIDAALLVPSPDQA